MIRGHASMFVGAALLASTTAFAQSTATSTSSTSTATTTAQDRESPAVDVTLIGCVQKESDYRKEHNLRRGGGLNVGIGEGDEYVLINATRVGSGSAASASGDCTSASGEAFEITGPREEEFKAFVGKRVEVTGKQKKAEIAASGQPTGGTNVMDGDLKLFEVEVSSMKEAAVATAQVERTETPAAAPATTAPEPATTAPAPATTAPAPATTPAPAPTATTGTQAAEPTPTGTAGQAQTAQPTTARELPRTASPLALYELASLLFFGGAYGVRRLRTK